MLEFTVYFVRLFFWSIYLASPLLSLFFISIITLGLVVGRIERWTKFDSLYWSLITATTVGYGDFRPVKKRSRILSVVIAMLGLMLTGIIIAVTLHTATVALGKYGNQQVIEMLKSQTSPKNN